MLYCVVDYCCVGWLVYFMCLCCLIVVIAGDYLVCAWGFVVYDLFRYLMKVL